MPKNTGRGGPRSLGTFDAVRERGGLFGRKERRFPVPTWVAVVLGALVAVVVLLVLVPAL